MSDELVDLLVQELQGNRNFWSPHKRAAQDGLSAQLFDHLMRLRPPLMDARQAGVLADQLVADLGESINLTALSGADVIYLDRVESAFPLRMELRPGTRVPIHCSASGKLFLAHLSPARRAAILDGLPLTRHTATTLTDRAALEAFSRPDPVRD